MSKSRSFWNEELNVLWLRSCKAERNYLRFKAYTSYDKTVKNNLRVEFKSCQKMFDKKYRFYKRKHKKDQLETLECNARTNPMEMWTSLKKLNNPPNTRTSLEILKQDGTISTDLREVILRWFQDISGLF